MSLSKSVHFCFECFDLKRSTIWALLFITFYLAISTSQLGMSSEEKIISVEFEVFGRVQGVFFRKYTEQEAKRLGLKGWCMNTRQDTVKGVIEGMPSRVNQMKTWLQKTGSPSSRIDKAVFTNEKDINQHTYDSFKIKR
ncbi:acylphosphatase-2 [Leptinotarsa decemlineata]|uniref:acylphosphatase-2 n=1 Tax=Leptinotarsa decemlineata TaxID=7539 RepID=UPI003D305894